MPHKTLSKPTAQTFIPPIAPFSKPKPQPLPPPRRFRPQPVRTPTSTLVSPTPRTTPSAPAYETAEIKSHPVPGHADWRFAGPPLQAGPLPCVIYFALTAQQSLELDPFNQFVKFVLADANMAAVGTPAGDATRAPCRVFSVTLPYHTDDMGENEAAFTRWAAAYESGGDLVGFFVRRVSETVDRLVADGYADPHAVYAAGLSRGGLMAAHLAVRNAYVKACLGLAPVTVLGDLPEFSTEVVGNQRARDKINRASLLNDEVVRKLVSIPVRFYMGNFDRRVGTRNAFELTHLLAEKAVMDEGVRSPPHEFIMYCSVGKQGHGTPPDVFCAGAEYILAQMKSAERRR